MAGSEGAAGVPLAGTISFFIDTRFALRYNALMPKEQLHNPEVARGHEQGDRMQRIRVGLTGLAVVLILVALTTALVSRIGGASTGTTAQAAVEKSEKSEPLAELGVAPGAPLNETQEQAPTGKP
jgi:hypothetical protein